jgi:hypothetical protein
LFQEVLALEPEERRDALAGVPPHIVAEVEALVNENEQETEQPEPGRTYGHYVLVAPLGSGAMGDVFSARDRELARMVAVNSSALADVCCPPGANG